MKKLPARRRATSTKVAKIKPGEVSALKAQGLGAAEIAKKLGIARASVYRVLGASA